MTHGVYDRSSSVGGLQQSSIPQKVEGQFGEHGGVKVGEAEGRAVNSTRTFFAGVKEFFSSLFGVKVSTPRPQSLDTPEDGAKMVLSDLTRKNLDTFDVMTSLGALHTLGEFDKLENRDQGGGMMPKTGTLFKDQIKDMNDMQLLRLHRNLQNHPELTMALTSTATAEAMARVDGDDQQQGVPDPKMKAAGKLNDIAYMMEKLTEDLNAEMEARGLDRPPIDPQRDVPMPEPLNKLVISTIENGGDILKASKEIRFEYFKDALDQMGMVGVSRGHTRTEPTYTPQERAVINARLEASGLPTLDELRST